MTIDEFVLKYNLEPIAKVKRIMPEGKQTLQEAIDALESQELKPLVSNTNASRIEEMKQLLD